MKNVQEKKLQTLEELSDKLMDDNEATAIGQSLIDDCELEAEDSTKSLLARGILSIIVELQQGSKKQ